MRPSRMTRIPSYWAMSWGSRRWVTTMRVVPVKSRMDWVTAAAVAQVGDIITQEKERGALVLLASHNYEDIRLLSDQVYRLASGRLREEGVG